MKGRKEGERREERDIVAIDFDSVNMDMVTSVGRPVLRQIGAGPA